VLMLDFDDSKRRPCFHKLKQKLNARILLAKIVR
jgi:hypothetical protein